jgi:hypothetical protein
MTGKENDRERKGTKERQVISMMEQLYWAIAIHRTSVRVHSLATLSATSKRRELSGVVAPRETPHLPARPRC